MMQQDMVLDNSLRPDSFESYIGQPKMVQRMNIALNAAKYRHESCPHVLFHGPPGTGKTSAANLISRAMGSALHTTSGPALETIMDALNILAELKTHDIWFVDEIHSIPATVSEVLYAAVEDFKVDVMVNGKPVNARLPFFTLVGATTRAGALTAPFRDRFGIVACLNYYSTEDLTTILRRSAGIMKVDIDTAGLANIAKRGRGTPRIANRLLARVRDYAMGKQVTPDMLDATFDLEEVDDIGLNALDRQYLTTLRDRFKGGPAGVRALASTMNTSPETLEEVCEGYLLHIGKIARTPRGRMLL
jgi:Holliday junction DNA helicase RuvB